MRQRIRVIYRKNIGMSQNEIAGQVAHAALGITGAGPRVPISVTGMSDGKYYQTIKRMLQNCINIYIVTTTKESSIECGTETCFSYMEI